MCLVIRNFGGCRMKLCSLKRRSPKCVSAVFDRAELNRRCDWRRRVVFAEMKVAEMCALNSTDTPHNPLPLIEPAPIACVFIQNVRTLSTRSRIITGRFLWEENTPPRKGGNAREYALGIWVHRPFRCV